MSHQSFPATLRRPDGTDEGVFVKHTGSDGAGEPLYTDDRRLRFFRKHPSLLRLVEIEPDDPALVVVRDRVGTGKD